MAIVDETIGEFFVLFTFGRLKAATIAGREEGFDVDEITAVVAACCDVDDVVVVVVVVVTAICDDDDGVDAVVVACQSFASSSAFSSLAAPPNVSSVSDVSPINGTDLMPEVSWVLS